MSQVLDADIAVIGFGPCGAMLATLAADAGLRVVAFDRDAEIYPKPRAIALDHEAMRLFQEIGLAEALKPHVAPFPPSVHFGAAGQPIRIVDMAPKPWPMGWPPSLVFDQPAFERLLRAAAVSRPGLAFYPGCTAEALEQDDTGVTLTLRSADGPRQLRVGHVIGCDGASSFTRRQLGLPLTDLGFDEPWLVVDLMVNPSGLRRLPDHAAQFCDPARPASFIIGTGAHRRWEIMLNPGEDPREMEKPEQVWPLLARWLGPEDASLWRAASYRFHALVADRWHDGRVFIAGDAAHQQPPFLGQGMCQGLRDAANLVWKLAAVRDGADPALLDSYATERRGHVATLTARIKDIGRMICERNVTAARARDDKLLASNGGVAPTVLRQDLVPPLVEGFLAAQDHPMRGRLFPQPRLADGQLMDTRFGTGWRIVAPGPLPVGLPGWITPVCIRPEDEAEGVVTDWFAKSNGVAALVRPDHHVFGVAADNDAIFALVAEIAETLRKNPN